VVGTKRGGTPASPTDLRTRKPAPSAVSESPARQEGERGPPTGDLGVEVRTHDVVVGLESATRRSSVARSCGRDHIGQWPVGRSTMVTSRWDSSAKYGCPSAAGPWPDRPGAATPGNGTPPAARPTAHRCWCRWRPAPPSSAAGSRSLRDRRRNRPLHRPAMARCRRRPRAGPAPARGPWRHRRDERSACTDSSPGRVSASTSWPASRRDVATSSHAHAPSQKPGTRTNLAIVTLRGRPVRAGP
jgi:hypothetical protein